MHALLSGMANHFAQEHEGMVNGRYVSIYYFSGAMGSWLPGYLYEGRGWSGMIMVSMPILGVCGFGLTRIKSGLSRT